MKKKSRKRLHDARKQERERIGNSSDGDSYSKGPTLPIIDVDLESNYSRNPYVIYKHQSIASRSENGSDYGVQSISAYNGQTAYYSSRPDEPKQNRSSVLYKGQSYYVSSNDFNFNHRGSDFRAQNWRPGVPSHGYRSRREYHEQYSSSGQVRRSSQYSESSSTRSIGGRINQ
jgi:YHS domain-containing protein